MQDAAQVLWELAVAKHALGYQLPMRYMSVPMLEVAIALLAIAQDELGHARLLYKSAQMLRGEEGHDVQGDRIAALPPEPGFVPRIENWNQALVTLATLDVAARTCLEALAQSADRNLSEGADRILGEEEFHVDYVRTWVGVKREDRQFRDALRDAGRRYVPWARGVYRNLAAMADRLGVAVTADQMERRFGDALSDVLGREMAELVLH